MKNLKAIREEHGAGEWGTDELTNKYKNDTPGQQKNESLKDACWKGYEAIGTKQKNGRTVPNCVPKEGHAEDAQTAHQAAHAALKKGDIDTYHQEMDKKFAAHVAASGEAAKKPVKTYEGMSFAAASMAHASATSRRDQEEREAHKKNNAANKTHSTQNEPTKDELAAAKKHLDSLGYQNRGNIGEASDEQKNLKITKHEKAAVEASKRGDRQAQQYHLDRVKSLKAESVQPVAEAKEEPKTQKHLVTVTVSDPHHTMVSKRKEKIMKRVKVSAEDPKAAIKKAEAHYKKHGFKVHDSLHHSIVNESLDTDEFVDSYDASNSHKDTEKEVTENSAEGEEQGLSDEDKAAIGRIKTLIRLGLLDNSQMQIAVRVLRKLDLDQPVVSSQERAVLAELLEKLVGVVTGDDAIFRKIRLSVQQQ